MMIHSLVQGVAQFDISVIVTDVIPDSLTSTSNNVDIPYSSAFNAYPSPEGFSPCPKGKKFACCILHFGLFEDLICIWYDYDLYNPGLKEILCQDQYIYCCADIVGAGYRPGGEGSGNTGIDCELATRSAFTVPDWADRALNILLFPNPLFRIPPQDDDRQPI